ncbi:MAG: hypothetical protein M1334_00810, partial [Patescibacteria group bacterium]|nr:hypothetical protein [Patescibacteria group bacterium]
VKYLTSPVQTQGLIKIMIVDPTHISLLAKIQNPNTAFGALSFSYSFEIDNSAGQSIQSVSGYSFIYPGEVKYLTAINVAVPDSSRVAQASLAIQNYNWQPSNKMALPDIEFSNQTTTITTSSITILGVITNKSSLALPAVNIMGILSNNLGLPAGVAKTEINSLQSLEARQFSLVMPFVNNINPAATKIYFEVPPSI